MKKLCALFIGLGLSSTLPASAAIGLQLACVASHLAPGTQVWLEVEPEYQQVAIPTQALQSERSASSAVTAAQGSFAWQFEIPASGQYAAPAHDFAFPIDHALSVERNSPTADRFGEIHLRVRFRIDTAKAQPKAAYGEVHEVTLAMPVPPGVTALGRCIRLREDRERLLLESAADCSDASFERARRGTRLQWKPPTP